MLWLLLKLYHLTLTRIQVVSVAFSMDTVLLPWQAEYSAGLQQEIYNVNLPSWFYGRSFSQMAIVRLVCHRCSTRLR